MKRLNLKAKVLLAAFILGGGAAGATEVIKQIAWAQLPLYDWTSHVSGKPDIDSTSVPEASEFYGCSSGMPICAQGQLVEGSGQATVTLHRGN